jgi:hypothetical protein
MHKLFKLEHNQPLASEEVNPVAQVRLSLFDGVSNARNALPIMKEYAFNTVS